MRLIVRNVLTWGITVSLLGMAAAAWLWTVMDFSERAAGVVGAVPLVLGAFSASVPTGRYLRHHGLAVGAVCGGLLTGIWYMAASIYCDTFRLPMLFFLTLPIGMAGGVVGVNCPPVPIRRRPHKPRIMARRLCLWLALLRKPPKYKKAPDE